MGPVAPEVGLEAAGAVADSPGIPPSVTAVSVGMEEGSVTSLL